MSEFALLVKFAGSVEPKLADLLLPVVVARASATVDVLAAHCTSSDENILGVMMVAIDGKVERSLVILVERVDLALGFGQEKVDDIHVAFGAGVVKGSVKLPVLRADVCSVAPKQLHNVHVVLSEEQRLAHTSNKGGKYKQPRYIPCWQPKKEESRFCGLCCEYLPLPATTGE